MSVDDRRSSEIRRAIQLLCTTRLRRRVYRLVGLMRVMPFPEPSRTRLTLLLYLAWHVSIPVLVNDVQFLLLHAEVLDNIKKQDLTRVY